MIYAKENRIVSKEPVAVSTPDGRPMALFRCTQIVLY